MLSVGLGEGLGDTLLEGVKGFATGDLEK